jgi:hypothetical protein
MQAGGRRKIKISPHLAYGEAGIPDTIPPNAVLHCEVELLEVRERGVLTPDDYPPGKHLFAVHPGEAARDLPRWQFGLKEDGRCGISLTIPVPGCTWRHARTQYVESCLDAATTLAVFEDTLTLSDRFPNNCLPREQLWEDSSEKAGSITRDRKTNALCVTVWISERGRFLCYCILREDSQALLNSRIYEAVTALLKSHPHR